MIAIYQERTGLCPDHLRLAPPVFSGVRMTIPVREAFIAHGAKVEQEASEGPHQTYRVTVTGRVPQGIVANYALDLDGTPHLALRLSDESEYPNEVRAPWWHRGAFLPCPECGFALVWYESGYVPGYRVCVGPLHHHVRLDEPQEG